MQLYNGDCLEVMNDISDNSIDMILCDLPYGTTACKWDTIIPFDKLWEQYNRIIKDDCAIVLFGSEPFSSKLRLSNINAYKYDWIWNKVRPIGAHVVKYRPMSQIENISVFCQTTLRYYPIKVPCKPHRVKEYKRTDIIGGSKTGVDHILTEKFPTNLLEFSNADMTNRFHPTQKPVPLLEYLIKTYTRAGDVVLDNCMGSGSTGVACVNTDRDFIGIELSTEYFEIAKNRINDACIHRKSRLF